MQADREALSSAFEAFDIDKSGTLSATELKEILTYAGVLASRPLSPADADELIAAFDTNMDGVLDVNLLALELW